MYIGELELAVVRDLGYQAISIDRITRKGYSFIDKAKILKTIEQGISSERAIAKNLELKQHEVNYYLEILEENGFVKTAKGYPVEEAGELEYKSCILKNRGKVALDDLKSTN